MKIQSSYLMKKEELDAWFSLPRTPSGHIIHPRFAERPWKDDYIRRLGQWCRANPRTVWPDWLIEYVRERQANKKNGSTVSVSGDRGSTEEAGDVREGSVSGQPGDDESVVAARMLEGSPGLSAVDTAEEGSGETPWLERQ